MAIWDDVSSGIRDAMRERDKVRTNALRNIRSAFLEEAKKDGSESIGDEACLEILRRLAKQRRESIDAYTAGGREELAADERAELAIVESFLPKRADEATTRALVAAVAAQVGATGPRDAGKVMGALMRDHKDAVDGALARRVLTELLGG